MPPTPKNKTNFINILIETLKVYDKESNLIGFNNAQEFVKNHICDMKLFLSIDQHKILTLFYDICSLREFLNVICNDFDLPKTKSGIVLLYLVLFYMSQTNKNMILYSMMEHIKFKKYHDKFLHFLQRSDLVEIVSRKSYSIYCTNADETQQQKNIHEYIVKEIKERIGMFKSLDKAFECIKQSRNLNKINFSIEDGHNVLMDYGTPQLPQISQEIIKDSPAIPITIPKKFPVRSSLIQKLKLTCKTLTPIQSEQLDSVNSFVSSTASLNNPKIKTTITQVLRQGAQIQKKEISSEKAIQDLCKGSNDPQNIKQLLEQIKQSEIDFELREIERKHLLGKISLEEARLAKLALQKKNRQNADELKDRNKELGRQLADFQAQEEARIRELIEKNHAVMENVKVVQARVRDQKRQNVQSIREESKELAALLAQKQQEELERKINLIRQIKELEHVSKNISFRTIFKDSVSELCINRTYKMSEEDLKRSLTTLKDRVSNEINERRAKIQNEKLRQQNLVQEIQNKINQHKTYDLQSSVKMKKTKNDIKMTPELIQLRRKLERKQREIAKIKLGA